ncbi:hypothetical protein [Methylobacterium gnaphalii]|uniref:Uncharacterized protein n=1 Tax=Methylobacterium gnaphalii TaxID=1010610 RepID=A0A512JM21_9HYPH|nr:hypothetical protein [Methylobacterium gnaphalii]GEP10998.1 hypothetical protein MGN01_28430 [Methylobacterium gnaphalii]GJD71200.1 hypothetical protein MMMDOFMJ_4154 [Methylobacterium gnaphalii]GLS50277.1 hypothetical protein GCM10007885_31290 [Methylobacterium gnaphalii]
MNRKALRSLAIFAPLLLASTGGASALSLPFEESEYLPPEETTTYVERSLNHQAPLTIEHPPVASSGRRGRRSAAIAGFCHEGGTITRRDSLGQPVLRQREVCDNVAPRNLWPGHTDPRPAWPAPRIIDRATLRSRG